MLNFLVCEELDKGGPYEKFLELNDICLRPLPISFSCLPCSRTTKSFTIKLLGPSVRTVKEHMGLRNEMNGPTHG